MIMENEAAQCDNFSGIVLIMYLENTFRNKTSQLKTGKLKKEDFVFVFLNHRPI